jgi:Ca2+-binding RTX toxin-like protein
MAGNDDIIGGHFLNIADVKAVQATSSSDLGDFIDAGVGDDVVLGDSGSIVRTLTDARMRTGSTTAGTTPMANPDSPARGVWLFTSATKVAATYGADVLAGGAGNDMIFGQAGADVIQGDGALDLNRNGILDTVENLGIGAWTNDAAYTKLDDWRKSGAKLTSQSAVGSSGGSATVTSTTPGMLDYVFGSLAAPETGTVGGGKMLAVKGSVTDFAGSATDGDDFIEGGSGNDVVFGNGGQDDIIGGSSDQFGGLVAYTGNTVPAANLAGADILFGGSGGTAGEMSSATGTGRAREGNVLVAGNASVLRFVASGAYQYIDNSVSGSTAGIVRRSVNLIDKAAANTANLSYLIGTGAQDMIVKSTLGDVAIGTKSAAQMKANVTGGSVLTAADAAVALTSVYAGITREAPSVAQKSYAVQPVTITVAAPLAVKSAKAVPTYTYNSATKAFSPVTGTSRAITPTATTVIDVKTATKQVAYFDSKGGFWMVA